MMRKRTNTTLVFVLVGLMVGILPATTLQPVAAASNTEALWIKQYYTTEGLRFFPNSLMLYPNYYLLFNNYLYYEQELIPYVMLSTDGKILSAKVLNITRPSSIVSLSASEDGNLLFGMPSKYIPYITSQNITVGKFDPRTSKLLWISTLNYNITTLAGYPVKNLYYYYSERPIIKEYPNGILWVLREWVSSPSLTYNPPILVIAKFSPAGDLQWAEYLYNVEWTRLTVEGIQEDSYGNIYLMGTIDQYTGLYSPWITYGYLFKLSSKNGSIIWAKHLYNTWDTYYVTPQGYVVLLENDAEYRELRTAIVDPNGKRLDFHDYPYPSDVIFSRLHIDGQTSDGGFLVSGSVIRNINSTYHMFPTLIKLDGSGNLVSAKYFTINNKDAEGMYVTPDEYGNLVFLTRTVIVSGKFPLFLRTTLLKLDPSGDINCPACQISDVSLLPSSVHGSTSLYNYSVSIEKLNATPVESPKVTIKLQPWDTLYSTPLVEETICYVPVPTPTTNITNNLNSYLTAGITWYFLFKHYSMMFNSTYQKAKGLNVSQELLANATNLSNEAYITFQKGVSEGSFLKFPLQKIPYIRKAYILLLKAYEILKRAIEST